MIVYSRILRNLIIAITDVSPDHVFMYPPLTICHVFLVRLTDLMFLTASKQAVKELTQFDQLQRIRILIYPIEHQKKCQFNQRNLFLITPKLKGTWSQWQISRTNYEPNRIRFIWTKRDSARSTFRNKTVGTITFVPIRKESHIHFFKCIYS